MSWALAERRLSNRRRRRKGFMVLSFEMFFTGNFSEEHKATQFISTKEKTEGTKDTKLSN